MSLERQTSLSTCVQHLRIWDKIEVWYVGRGDEWFKTRVEDATEDKLYISRPGPRVRVHYGARVNVNFLREDGLYTFGAVIDSEVNDGHQQLILKPQTSVRHRQRRAAVRIDVRMDLTVANIPRPIEEPLEVEALRFEPSVCVNFSASGALIRATSALCIGDTLALSFSQECLPPAPQYILASWRRLQQGSKHNFIGLEFIKRDQLSAFLQMNEIQYIPDELKMMDAAHENAFSKFVFEYELRQRQLGNM